MDNIQCAAQFAAEVEHPFEGRAEASIGKLSILEQCGEDLVGHGPAVWTGGTARSTSEMMTVVQNVKFTLNEGDGSWVGGRAGRTGLVVGLGQRLNGA